MGTADAEETARVRDRRRHAAMQEADVGNTAGMPRHSRTLVNMCLSLMPLCFCVPQQI